jgi:hypothetical protein
MQGFWKYISKASDSTVWKEDMKWYLENTAMDLTTAPRRTLLSYLVRTVLTP